jgi:hypothetical protein
MPKPLPHRAPDPMAGVVDRLLAQLPGLQGHADPVSVSPRQATQFGTVATPIRAQPATPGEWIAVWTRVLLGLSLGIMIAGWPYSRSCGFPLLGYISAVGIVAVAGAWAAVSSWRYRSPLAHVVSLIILFYGILLGVAELLPRTGYAAYPATWQCEDATPAGLVLGR